MNNEMPRAIIEKRKKSNITWIIPFVALFATAWLIYKSVSEAGVDIVVNFQSGNGFKEGKTNVFYKGYNLGKVTKVTVGNDLKGVNAHIRISKEAAGFITKEGTDFWIVQPRFSVSKVSGLDTIISGVYIEVRPVSLDVKKLASIKKKLYFNGYEQKPLKYHKEDGKNITLLAKNLSGIHIGTPILYKKFIIGEVIATNLEKNSVKVFINIQKDYEKLVNSSTVFWNVSGVNVNADLSGINLKVDSLTSLISGGISFETLDVNAKNINKSKDEFILHENYENAKHEHVPVNLIFKTAKGLVENKTEIIYKGIPIGKIKTISLLNDTIVAKAYINKKFEKFNTQGTKYHKVDIKVDNFNVENLGTVLKGLYINIIPGNGKVSNTFTVFDSKDKAINSEVTKITIKSNKLFNLDIGSKIYYKNIIVGQVDDYKFTKDLKNVIIYSSINNKYKHLLNEKTLFYSISTPLIESKNLDFKINYEGFKPLLNGGIGLEYAQSNIQGENDKFWLYDSYFELLKVKQKYVKGKRIHIQIDDNVKLKHDMPIYYNSRKIGHVEGFDYSKHIPSAILFIEDKYKENIKNYSKFYTPSSVDIQANLNNGVKVKIDSFDNILNGKIILTNKFYNIDDNLSNAFKFKLYGSLDDLPIKKYNISLDFENIDGLSANNSKILYKGIVVGKVTQIKLNSDLKTLNAKAYLYDEYKNLASNGSIFYIVKPNISLSQVSNLDTLIKGSYINIIKGEGSLVNSFNVYTNKPNNSKIERGVSILLTSKDSGSLTTNSLVYYKKIKVGEVESIDLNKNSKLVNIKLFIYDKFKNLIRENSKFYNVSGMDIDVSLTGGKIKTDSLNSVIFGGVSFSTPNDFGRVVSENKVFNLHEKMKDEWKSYNPEIILD